MSSNIDFESVDSSYPIEGQDNPSQGFRDNFSAIKNGLAVAYAEISELQNKAVLKQPLDADTSTSTVEHDLGLATVYNAVVRNLYGVVSNSLIENGATTVNISLDGDDNAGHIGTYFKYLVENQFTSINLKNWPDNYVKIRLELISDGTARTINFLKDGNNIFPKKTNNISQVEPTVTTSVVAGTSKIIDIWSTDGGDVVFFDFIGEFSQIIE